MVLRETLDPDSSLWDWLAFDLHLYRNRAGMSCAQLGDVLGINRQAVSNLETGRRGYRLDTPKCRKLDEYWHTGGHFQRILKYARAGHDPDWFRQFVEYEDRASILKVYELSFVPGLLQTPEYARALLSAGQATDMDGDLQVRMRRQEILRRNPPPLLWVLMHWAALEQPVGDVQVRRAQLAHLIDVSRLDNVIVRVIPKSAGEHVGLEGSFQVATVAEGDVAYMEACGGGRLSLDKAEVRKFAIRYDRLGADALSREATRRLISQVMEATT